MLGACEVADLVEHQKAVRASEPVPSIAGAGGRIRTSFSAAFVGLRGQRADRMAFGLAALALHLRAVAARDRVVAIARDEAGAVAEAARVRLAARILLDRERAERGAVVLDAHAAARLLDEARAASNLRARRLAHDGDVSVAVTRTDFALILPVQAAHALVLPVQAAHKQPESTQRDQSEGRRSHGFRILTARCASA